MEEERRPQQSQPTPPSSDSGTDAKTGPQAETSRDARNMAMLCHLLGALGLFAHARARAQFAGLTPGHGRAAMNYQISLLIYGAIFGMLCVVFIGFVLLSLLSVAHIVLIIVGTVRAYHGQPWRYPIAIPFLK